MGEPNAIVRPETNKPQALDLVNVIAQVRTIASSEIGDDSGISFDTPLLDSGMDSLAAVSFRNSLQSTMSVKLPASLLFDHPTMREIAACIVEASLERA